MNWIFRIYDHWQDIWDSHHLDYWNRHFESSYNAHVFFHSSLVKVWVDTYLPLRNLNPIFIWGKTNDDNEVFFPLVLWKKSWKGAFIRTIIPIGYSDYDYHDPVFLRKPSFKEVNCFWQDLQSYLDRYSVDEIELSGIHKENMGDMVLWNKEDVCPFLSLENIRNENDLMSFFKTSLRGDIRRQIRRLSELGEISIKEYQTYSEVNNTFSKFMEEHSLRWPNAYKAPLFHRRLLSDELLGKTVHFSSLNINDNPVAWHLGFSYQGVYYYYMPAGNHEYSNYSPVKVHLYFLLNRAVSLGYKKYDHLRGEENYKAGWSNGCEDLYGGAKMSPNVISKLKVFGYKKIISLIK